MKTKMNVSDILTYVLAGKAIFTLHNPLTDKSFTFKVSKPKECDKWFVKVLTGPENTKDYSYLGFITADKKYIHGRGKAKIGVDAPSNKAFSWFMGKLTDGAEVNLGPAEVYPSCHCARCGRLLTHKESVTALFGPECIKLVA